MGGISWCSSCGSTPHFLALVDVKTEEIVQKRRLKQCWFGLAAHPNGKAAYVAAGAEDVIRTFDLSNGLAEGKPIALPKKTFPSGLAWIEKANGFSSLAMRATPCM